ncbi:hypothetical protein SAMN05216389_12270 [Oceanobacillus limi]|uniref:Thioredoxin n=1 Tax=Oceanobacillus limi TaxID=930131 RepID=A0A1I0GLI0_9BACI|nr:hypothetical protein [Oceanobacillus limi]SET71876.1 hypothetical protein SAMN05216389_12270 [Oceanobacillus limi]
MKGTRKTIASFFLLFLLFACSSEKDDFGKHYPELLPGDHSNFSILTIGEEVTRDMLYDHDINDVSPIIYYSSMEHVENSLPQLELEKSPAFVVFDENGFVAKANHFEGLVEILQEQADSD